MEWLEDMGATDDNWFGNREVGMKTNFHIAQNSALGELREYSDLWMWPFRRARAIKLEEIEDNIPVRAVWASNDYECYPSS